MSTLAPRTESGLRLLAYLRDKGLAADVMADAIYDVEAESGLGHEACPDCGHRLRAHGIADTPPAGCWEAKCGCRRGVPPKDAA